MDEVVRNIESLDELKDDKFYILVASPKEALTDKDYENILNDKIWGPFDTKESGEQSEHYKEGNVVMKGYDILA